MDLSVLSMCRPRAPSFPDRATDYSSVAADLDGRQVLTAYAPVEHLGWFIFAEPAASKKPSNRFTTGLYRSGLLFWPA